MKKLICILFLSFLLTACTNTEENLELSSRENPHEGLNLFTVSEEQGLIEGTYIEGDYRVDFEARRGQRRPLGAFLMDPTLGYSFKEILTTPQIILYDVSACYISKQGDPFIVQDSCSLPPLCPPEKEDCIIDEETRTKEFQLAEKAAQELQNISFPKSLERNKQTLTSIGNLE